MNTRFWYGAGSFAGGLIAFWGAPTHLGEAENLLLLGLGGTLAGVWLMLSSQKKGA